MDFEHRDCRSPKPEQELGYVKMVRSYQLDLEKTIWACPKNGRKQRYRDGIGYVTADDFPSR